MSVPGAGHASPSLAAEWSPGTVRALTFRLAKRKQVMGRFASDFTMHRVDGNPP